MIKLTIQKPDALGILASVLCIIHCLAAPLIFVAHTFFIGGYEISSSWWRNLDYIFLIISLLAVKRSVENTSVKFMKIALWLSWLALFLLIINEKIELVELPEIMTYSAALSLAVLHIYNLKFCRCKTDKCCNHNG